MNQASVAIRNDYAGQPQILLMEDESSVAQGLQMVLREEGYGVDLAMTGHGMRRLPRLVFRPPVRSQNRATVEESVER